MSFWGARRRAGAVVAALLLVAGCSNAEAEDPGESSPSASAETSETPAGASAEATQDGGASAEADGSASGDDDSAPPSPDPNRPEAQLPKRPAAMDEHTVEGAIAAGKYFMSLFDYVFATGDLSDWETLSQDGCGFCGNVAEQAQHLHDAGGYTVGGEVQIYAEDGGGPYEKKTYIVQLGVRFDEATQIYADGTEKKLPGADRPNLIISLKWRNDAWVVAGVLTEGLEGQDS